MIKKKKFCFWRAEKTEKNKNRSYTGVFGFLKNIRTNTISKKSFFVLGFSILYIWQVSSIALAASSNPCGNGLSVPSDWDACWTQIGNAARTGDRNDGSGFFESIAVKVLQAVISVLGWIVNAAAAILSWTIDPKLLYDLMQNVLIYQWWQMVRDILNICFIGVLLLSAFSTIFQIDRYHYRKILLNLIIMALLVNFSFPIARFVIDFANRLMYFILSLSQIASAGLSSTDFGDVFLTKSQIVNVLVTPAEQSKSVPVLLMSVIMLFLFAIALLIVAVQMLIRVVALMLVVIFSPVGFVGRVVPGMEGYAAKWWSQLFKYAFFGPMVVFMLTLSVSMMSALTSNSSGLTSALSKNSKGDLASVAKNFALEFIPIVMLYVSIGTGSRMSLYGAGKVEKSISGWGNKAAKWTAGWGVAVGTLGAYPYVRDYAKNAKAGWDERRGQIKADKDKRQKALGKGAASLVFDRPVAGEKWQWNRDAARRLKVEKDAKRNERVKQNEETQRSHTDLVNDMRSNDEVQKEAAALTLANKKDFSKDDLNIALDNITDRKVKEKVISAAPEQAFGDHETFMKAFNSMGDEPEPQAVRELINKGTADTFEKMSVEEYRKISQNEAVKRAGLDKALQSRMKDNKGAHILVQDFNDANKNDPTKAGKGYEETVKKMNANQLANQDKSFYTDDQVSLDAAVDEKNYQKDNIQQIMRTAGEKNNTEALKYWNSRLSQQPQATPKQPKAKPQAQTQAQQQTTIVNPGGQTPQQLRAQQAATRNQNPPIP